MYSLSITLLWALHTILESLPISSSGHLSLLLRFLHEKKQNIVGIPAYLTHSMHVTTLGILTIFLATHWQDFFPAELTAQGLFGLCSLILAANTITIFCYVVLQFLPSLRTPLPLGFLITTVVLLSLFFISKLDPTHNCLLTQLTIRQAAFIGLIQGIALLPGISRMASTVTAGCWLGLLPAQALLFSCAIQLPLVCAAVAHGLYTLAKKRFVISWNLLELLTLLIACIIAYLLLQLLVSICLYTSWAAFGIYMFVPTVLALSSN